MLKKIAVSHLKPGMFLNGLCGSWITHPFWRSRFQVADWREIRSIADAGVLEVWIDTEKGADVAAAEGAAKADAAAALQLAASAVPAADPKPASMQEELQRASRIIERSKRAVMSMFHEVRMGKAISKDAADQVVQDVTLSVMRNPGALISLARLKTVDDYTYMHSVAVCALMVALARQLHFDPDQTRETGMGGLLHDLGKAVMPAEILTKPAKLTDQEFEVMKCHMVEGHRLLREAGIVGSIPLDVCLHHHERIDGSGYPFGLKDEQISVHAKMAAVCDVYDAITSNRPYKAGWHPVESIKKMTEWSARQYDSQVFKAFVNSIGIYPTGSLVRLSSGRLGVVVEQSAKSFVAPKVKLFFSTKSRVYIKPEIVDLSRSALDGNSEEIVGHEDPAHWNIKNFDQMWAE